MKIPKTQQAIQLIGPEQLRLNPEKEVFRPGPYQVLVRVQAVGLCFSDLKLLKQFDAHPRKSEILSGIDPAVLSEMPAYCPGSKPTVPGHEIFCTIIAVGRQVRHHTVGQQVLVQTDYRWLKTAGSNAGGGYNFEGALQQYLLLEERVFGNPDSQESYLIVAEKEIGGAAAALVEPWACVESSYINEERQTILPGGNLLLVADKGTAVRGVRQALPGPDAACSITALCAETAQGRAVEQWGLPYSTAASLETLPDASFDDIIYFGNNKQTIETLNDKLAARGIINIVLGGRQIGAPVSIGVGRVHYGVTRWIGTTGTEASESYRHIPKTGEIRDGDQAAVIGAGGPMGQMHVIRLICSGKENLSVTATDLDDQRLGSLDDKVRPLLKSRPVQYRSVNTQTSPDSGIYSYYALMAPVGPLVAQAVSGSRDKTLINIFAGIPAAVRQAIDLDTYIANRCFMFGTSGSRLEDMKIVLNKVVSGQLDTNCSVDAVSGMAGAIDGIRAVENRTLSGKIIVYPALEKMPLLTLPQVCGQYPTVADKLNHGIWTKEAEQELLKAAE